MRVQTDGVLKVVLVDAVRLKAELFLCSYFLSLLVAFRNIDIT